MGNNDRKYHESVYSYNYNRATKKSATTGRAKIRDMKKDIYGNLFLGKEKSKYETENHKTFIDHKAKKTVLGDELQKDLRAHHWRLAHEKKNTSAWRTVNQERMQDKTLENTNNPGEAKRLLGELRKENFNIGQFDNVYESQSQATYKNIKGKQASLNPEIAKDLRAHHFGENMQNDYISSNKVFYKGKEPSVELTVNSRFF